MAMDKKMFTCAVLIAAAATMSVALATESPAPAPTSGVEATMPALFGASIISIFAFLLH
ncbi:hypothetical protein HYC85_024706 [Camellia sinensis]|uniref:Uncharacterized protein n=1 Tax=Camellia sinensis TaxID=4442 RepID=A0A7J7G8W4_CAMSI|nr:hypothetical protein HYC85_024706 [Camellia sinensis]